MRMPREREASDINFIVFFFVFALFMFILGGRENENVKFVFFCVVHVYFGGEGERER